MVHVFDDMLDVLQMFYDMSQHMSDVLNKVHMSDVLNKVHMFDIIIYNIHNIYNI